MFNWSERGATVKEKSSYKIDNENGQEIGRGEMRGKGAGMGKRGKGKGKGQGEGIVD